MLFLGSESRELRLRAQRWRSAVGHRDLQRGRSPDARHEVGGARPGERGDRSRLARRSVLSYRRAGILEWLSN